MARTRHHRQRDHLGVDLASNITLDSSTDSYGAGDDLQTIIGDLDTRAGGGGGGGGGTVVGVVAECNTSPSGTTEVPWDTFYDVDYNDLSGVIPAGVKLTYSAGVFTATGDGFYNVVIAADIIENPGAPGGLQISAPNFGYNLRLDVEAAGNPTRWVAVYVFPMRSGATFKVDQFSTDVIDGYATLEIYRIAGL